MPPTFNLSHIMDGLQLFSESLVKFFCLQKVALALKLSYQQLFLFVICFVIKKYTIMRFSKKWFKEAS